MYKVDLEYDELVVLAALVKRDRRNLEGRAGTPTLLELIKLEVNLLRPVYEKAVEKLGTRIQNLGLAEEVKLKKARIAELVAEYKKLGGDLDI